MKQPHMFGWLAQWGRATDRFQFSNIPQFLVSTYCKVCTEVGVHMIMSDQEVRERVIMTPASGGGKACEGATRQKGSRICSVFYSFIFFATSYSCFGGSQPCNRSHQCCKLVGSELAAEELNNSRDCGSTSCPEATWLRTCADEPTVFVKMSMLRHCLRIWHELDFVQNGCSRRNTLVIPSELVSFCYSAFLLYYYSLR